MKHIRYDLVIRKGSEQKILCGWSGSRYSGNYIGSFMSGNTGSGVFSSPKQAWWLWCRIREQYEGWKAEVIARAPQKIERSADNDELHSDDD